MALSSQECQIRRTVHFPLEHFSSGGRLPKHAAMRTQGFRTHVLLVLAGVVAVLGSLQRPWYGQAPPPAPEQAAHIGDVNGPLEGFFQGIRRWVSDPSGVTGWDALGTVGQVIAALAVVAALAALGCMAGEIQRFVSEPLRYAAVAVLALVAWKLVDPPGANTAWELRHGALIGAGGAIVLAVCAQSVASAPRRKRVVTPRYVAPPPPPAYEPPRNSTPPPGV